MDKLFLQQLQQLIALPSVSCTDPNIDQSNVAVIDLLASWFSSMGFSCEIMPIAQGKANLIATLGTGSGGLEIGRAHV